LTKEDMECIYFSFYADPPDDVDYASGDKISGYKNRVLQIANRCNQTFDLFPYIHLVSQPNGGKDWEHFTAFPPDAVIPANGFYLICHPDITRFGTKEINSTHCDMTHAYLSNGDDAYGIAYVQDPTVKMPCENCSTTIDIIGYIGSDPGKSFTVCGHRTATVDNYMRRKIGALPNFGDWEASAGICPEDCEWSVTDHPASITGEFRAQQLKQEITKCPKEFYQYHNWEFNDMECQDVHFPNPELRTTLSGSMLTHVSEYDVCTGYMYRDSVEANFTTEYYIATYDRTSDSVHYEYFTDIKCTSKSAWEPGADKCGVCHHYCHSEAGTPIPCPEGQATSYKLDKCGTPLEVDGPSTVEYWEIELPPTGSVQYQEYTGLDCEGGVRKGNFDIKQDECFALDDSENIKYVSMDTEYDRIDLLSYGSDSKCETPKDSETDTRVCGYCENLCHDPRTGSPIKCPMSDFHSMMFVCPAREVVGPEAWTVTQDIFSDDKCTKKTETYASASLKDFVYNSYFIPTVKCSPDSSNGMFFNTMCTETGDIQLIYYRDDKCKGEPSPPPYTVSEASACIQIGEMLYFSTKCTPPAPPPSPPPYPPPPLPPPSPSPPPVVVSKPQVLVPVKLEVDLATYDEAKAQASAAKATAAALGVSAEDVTVDEQYVEVKSEVSLPGTVADFDAAKFNVAYAKDMGVKAADVTSKATAGRRRALLAGVKVDVVVKTADAAAAKAVSTKAANATSLVSVAADVGKPEVTKAPVAEAVITFKVVAADDAAAKAIETKASDSGGMATALAAGLKADGVEAKVTVSKPVITLPPVAPPPAKVDVSGASAPGLTAVARALLVAAVLALALA